MAKALELSRREDNGKLFAIIYEENNDGTKSIIDIFEMEDGYPDTELKHVVADWYPDITHVRLKDGEWIQPDEITVWEAAEAACSVYEAGGT